MKRSARGFTLIELMMVVAIIGLLAALAVPNFKKFTCRARSGEAKVMLKHISTAQESYLAEHDIYASDAGQIPPVLAAAVSPGADAKYDFSVPTGTDAAYVAVATGKATGSQVGDRWEIDQNLSLSHVSVAPACQ